MEKQLRRSRDKKWAGVCAGLAEYFGLDVTLVRAVYATATIFCAGFPGFILYLILLFVMPEAEN